MCRVSEAKPPFASFDKFDVAGFLLPLPQLCRHSSCSSLRRRLGNSSNHFTSRRQASMLLMQVSCCKELQECAARLASTRKKFETEFWHDVSQHAPCCTVYPPSQLFLPASGAFNTMPAREPWPDPTWCGTSLTSRTCINRRALLESIPCAGFDPPPRRSGHGLQFPLVSTCQLLCHLLIPKLRPTAQSGTWHQLPSRLSSSRLVPLGQSVLQKPMTKP